MGYQAVVVACLFVVGTCHGEGKFVTRKTKYGRVRGLKTKLAQSFLGVPFAAPAERWMAPTEPSRWRGVLDTLAVKPQCFQGNNCTNENPPFSCVRMESEDCLYLNIYTPKRARRSSRKPVLVFIHGGGFDTGTPSALVFDGQMLAKKGDIIVVNIAYRITLVACVIATSNSSCGLVGYSNYTRHLSDLTSISATYGAFGFLVTGTSGDAITGNYGLMDQRLAMQWVKDNIANFGGDPEKITVAGQSAGAYSTAIHLTSGKADDLFQQAILQSSPFGITSKPLDIAIEQGLQFAIVSSCIQSVSTVNVSCLRSLLPESVVEYMGAPSVTTFSDSVRRSVLPWIPHIDGDEVKADIMESLVNTTFPGKKVVIGTTTEEAALYVKRIFPEPVNALIYTFSVLALVPDITADILDLYEITDFSDTRDVLEEMGTDFFFICPTRKVSRSLANLDNVYMYSFNQQLYFDELFENLPQCEGKVCHSFEIPFIFQSARVEPYKFTADERGLSDKMIAYWSAFAKYGNPNRGIMNTTEWLRYKTKGGNQDYLLEFLVQDNDLPLFQGYRSVYCNAFDTIGYA